MRLSGHRLDSHKYLKDNQRHLESINMTLRLGVSYNRINGELNRIVNVVIGNMSHQFFGLLFGQTGDLFGLDLHHKTVVKDHFKVPCNKRSLIKYNPY